MDYEALKDQWSDIEDRDGIRLSWNTFPSSRMVCARPHIFSSITQKVSVTGGIQTGGPHRSRLYAPQGEAGYSIATI